jgi:hypothetical protein
MKTSLLITRIPISLVTMALLLSACTPSTRPSPNSTTENTQPPAAPTLTPTITPTATLAPTETPTPIPTLSPDALASMTPADKLAAAPDEEGLTKAFVYQDKYVVYQKSGEAESVYDLTTGKFITPQEAGVIYDLTIGENTYTATVTSDEAMEIEKPADRDFPRWELPIYPSQNYTDIMAIGVPIGYVDRVTRMKIKDPEGSPIKLISFRMKYFIGDRTIYANYSGVESDIAGAKITLGEVASLAIASPLNEQYSPNTISSLKKEMGLTDLEAQIVFGDRDWFKSQEIKKIFTSAKDGDILNFGFQALIASFTSHSI